MASEYERNPPMLAALRLLRECPVTDAERHFLKRIVNSGLPAYDDLHCWAVWLMVWEHRRHFIEFTGKDDPPWSDRFQFAQHDLDESFTTVCFGVLWRTTLRQRTVAYRLVHVSI